MTDTSDSNMNNIPTANGAWCPEFYPTRAEFASFAKYIRTKIEPECAKIGMCKIIPPRGWFSRSYDLEKLDATVSNPVSQHVAGKKGIYNVDLVERKTMTVPEFKALAETLSDGEPTDNHDVDIIERQFWKSLRPTMDAPVYGADIVASLFGDADALSWNLNNLDTILRRIDLPGITRPMLYFGMWRAMFAFHTEDMDLYSINYLHTGKPKFWYAVPPDAARQLERAAQSMFPEKDHACSQFMRHKTSLISPARLREFGIPYSKAFQKPGEFVITFPAAYHQGFNLGFNIAEAVNFATFRWIPRGLKAKVCMCSPDSVRIDMDTFLPKLFETPETNPDILGDDPWVFSCKCNKYFSSDDPNYEVEEQWFECSTCKIWAHVRCIHPSYADAKAEDLPQSLLCHRCSIDDSSAEDEQGVNHKLHQTGETTVVRKRKKPASSLKEKSPEAPSAKRTATSTPTKKGKRSSFRKKLFIKGSTIQFEDTEAKVAAVDGNFIRVHYKGQSVEKDEWLPLNSKELCDRIVTISPPPRIAKVKSAVPRT